MANEAVKRVAAFHARDFAAYDDRSRNASPAIDSGAGC